MVKTKQDTYIFSHVTIKFMAEKLNLIWGSRYILFSCLRIVSILEIFLKGWNNIETICLQMLRGIKWFSLITQLLRGRSGIRTKTFWPKNVLLLGIFCTTIYRSLPYLYLNRAESPVRSSQHFALIYCIYFIYFFKSCNEAPFDLNQVTFLFSEIKLCVQILLSILLEKEKCKLSINRGKQHLLHILQRSKILTSYRVHQYVNMPKGRVLPKTTIKDSSVYLSDIFLMLSIYPVLCYGLGIALTSICWLHVTLLKNGLLRVIPFCRGSKMVEK